MPSHPKPTFRSTDFASWFTAIPAPDAANNYLNLRLRARTETEWTHLRPVIAQYLEWAHADARRKFHEDLSISLDPRGGPPLIEYPRSLPVVTRKGYFGEIFCGLLAEAEQVHIEHKWTVPIFLFCLHSQAEEFLMRLITGEPVAGTIVGRTGSDCIALSLNEDGTMKAILGAEAKCYTTFNMTKACDALADLGKQAAVPVSLGQLKRLLAEIDPIVFEATILDIEKNIKNTRPSNVPRHDLLVLIFEDPNISTYNSPRISAAEKSTHYLASRPLQVVEVHLPGAGVLIEQLYAGIYNTSEDDSHAPVH